MALAGCVRRRISESFEVWVYKSGGLGDAMPEVFKNAA